MAAVDGPRAGVDGPGRRPTRRGIIIPLGPRRRLNDTTTKTVHLDGRESRNLSANVLVIISLMYHGRDNTVVIAFPEGNGR